MSPTIELPGVAGLERRGTVTLLPDPPAAKVFSPFISADDHLLEPPDLFESRLGTRDLDSAPRVVTYDDGNPYWLIDDALVPITLVNGAAGRPIEEWRNAPQRYEDFRTSVYDSRARLADMDLIAMWASLCFPSMIWGFAGSRFLRMTDQRLGLACLRAYNDWMIEQWCAADPDRFIPCQLPWLADPEVAADEIRRNAARGFRAVSFSENPEGQGLPSVNSLHWDPFFAACEETGTVVNLHVGSSGRITNPAADSANDARVALFPVSGMVAMVDWIFARVPLRFPGLKIVLSEAGFSWVPTILERLARADRQRAASQVWQPGDPSPVEVAQRNFWFTSIEDPSGFRNLDLIGQDRVMVEADFPHQDTSWPDTQAYLESQLHALDDDTVRQVCIGNAAAVYRWPEPPADFPARA
jgi:predicted TIM-barrel fold metal-dependent hydrolase